MHRLLSTIPVIALSAATAGAWNASRLGRLAARLPRAVRSSGREWKMRSRQEQLEADLARTRAHDLIVLAETQGTAEVHKEIEVVN